MSTTILFFISTISFYQIFTAYLPLKNPNVIKAIRARGDTQTTALQIWVNKIALSVLPYIDLDEITHGRLQSDLQNTDTNYTPELFAARAIASGIVIAVITLPLLLISPLFILVTLSLGIGKYKTESSSLSKQIKERRRLIERELPQFAGTIRQSLSSTRSIIAILESYMKVCGPALRGEIEKTLNDIKIGNDEKALMAFDRRINSSKVSELIRGLLAVIRGEDQKLYFEILTHEYIKSENESIRRELIKRPFKLKPYNMLLLGSMAVMFLTGIVVSLAQG